MSLLKKTLQQIQPQNAVTRKNARNRLDQLVMPHWALGDLMDLSLNLAGMTHSIKPVINNKAIIIMAGDHGVVAEGVSKYPAEVTSQMIQNFVNGGAGINALAKQADCEIIVVDMGVNADLKALVNQGKIIDKKVALGTENIAIGAAMHRSMAQKAVESGIEIANQLNDRIDIFGTGDMGIGNTTPSTAIAAIITGKPVHLLTGRGTGLNDRQLSHKIKIIEQALEVNQPDPTDGLDILAKIGGFEIGGITGLILGAAANQKPVVIDGFISGAAALIACHLMPFVRDYIICAHRSVEPGHKIMQANLACKPLLDLNLRLGEGTGAALAMSLIDASVAILTDVKTFDEAAVRCE